MTLWLNAEKTINNDVMVKHYKTTNNDVMVKSYEIANNNLAM